MKIAIIGNINFDVNAKGVFSKNTEENRINEIKLTLGGTAANTAVSLANLGLDVDIYGSIGNDEFGFILIKKLKEYRINTEYIKMNKESKTGFCFINVDDNGQRHLFTYRGTNEDYLPELKEKYDYIHMAGLNTEQVSYILEQKSAFKKSSYNPGGIVTFEESKNILKLSKEIDILIFNETEYNYIFNYGKPSSKIIIKTLGKNGSEANDLHAESYKTKIVDTTGAGDAFNAGFIYNYLNGNDIQDCLRFGNKLGSFICNHQGANLLFSLSEIEQFNF